MFSYPPGYRKTRNLQSERYTLLAVRHTLETKLLLIVTQIFLKRVNLLSIIQDLKKAWKHALSRTFRHGRPDGVSPEAQVATSDAQQSAVNRLTTQCSAAHQCKGSAGVGNTVQRERNSSQTPDTTQFYLWVVSVQWTDGNMGSWWDRDCFIKLFQFWFILHFDWVACIVQKKKSTCE